MSDVFTVARAVFRMSRGEVGRDRAAPYEGGQARRDRLLGLVLAEQVLWKWRPMVVGTRPECRRASAVRAERLRPRPGSPASRGVHIFFGVGPGALCSAWAPPALRQGDVASLRGFGRHGRRRRGALGSCSAPRQRRRRRVLNSLGELSPDLGSRSALRQRRRPRLRCPALPRPPRAKTAAQRTPRRPSPWDLLHDLSARWEAPHRHNPCPCRSIRIQVAAAQTKQEVGHAEKVSTS